MFALLRYFLLICVFKKKFIRVKHVNTESFLHFLGKTEVVFT